MFARTKTQMHPVALRMDNCFEEAARSPSFAGVSLVDAGVDGFWGGAEWARRDVAVRANESAATGGVAMRVHDACNTLWPPDIPCRARQQNELQIVGVR